MPRVINTYITMLHGQLVEVKVYSPGKTRNIDKEDITIGVQDIENIDLADDCNSKDLTEIFEEIDRYVEDSREEEEGS